VKELIGGPWRVILVVKAVNWRAANERGD